MEDIKSKFCRLCLKGVSNFEEIQECIEEVLEVVLLRLDLDGKDVMCNECSGKLLEAFNFKVMCIDTEDSIIPHIDSQQDIPIDLKDIYLKIKEDIQPNYVRDFRKICRLCFELINYEFVSIDKVHTDVINNYIPEVNFSATKNPIVCMHCFDALNRHSSFLKNCSDLEVKIKNIFVFSGEKEEVEIKKEKNCEKESFLPRDHFESTKEKSIPNVENKLQKDKRKKKYKCETCSYRSEHLYNFKRHQLTHKRMIYQCTECNYKVYDKNKFVKHQLRHKKLECSKCQFRTKYKKSLTRHELKHKTDSQPKISKPDTPRDEIQVKTTNKSLQKDCTKIYKCDKCNYETKYEKYLTSHKLHRHRDITLTYKCHHCTFETKYKQNLKKHEARHENPNTFTLKCTYQTKKKCNSTFLQPKRKQFNIYKCDKCEYEITNKKLLKKHQSVHNRKVYTCFVCKYNTYERGNYIRHQLTHIDNSEVKLYCCYKCDFKTKHKNNLRRHQLVHEKPLKPVKLDETKEKKIHKQKLYTCTKSNDKKKLPVDRTEATLYSCDKCDFKSKVETKLKRHLSTHEKPGRQRTHKCTECDFKATSIDVLWNHRKGHKNMTFQCSDCSFVAKFKMNLMRHRVVHKNQVVKEAT